jgi:colanic acid/amylovoran biosynthesis glycosyltransferase
VKYLNVVSIFPALTETFVIRELRAMREIGCDVVIGQLRPAGRRPTAAECGDLHSFVVRAELLSAPTCLGIVFFTARKPKLLSGFLRLAATYSDAGNMFKLIYILLASVNLAYRMRDAGISHVRGHHLHSEAVSAMFIAGLLDIPYSFTCHTTKIYYPRPVVEATIRRADFIVANISQVKEFLQALGARESQISIVRNGVSIAQFPRRYLTPVEGLPIILAVGRLDYKKGFHVLISACAALRDAGVRFRCVIVGDGNERANLLARRGALHLEDSVEFAGSLGFGDVQRCYEQATVLAVPSVVAPDGATDGLPTVIIEAFANGVPAVGSATAGIPEIIRNGVNGFVVAAGSARELADAIEEMLSNRELRSKFAAEARRTVERDFDLDHNVRVLADLMFGEAQPWARRRTSTIEAVATAEPASPLR